MTEPPSLAGLAGSSRTHRAALLSLPLLLAAACGGGADLVVYVAHDQTHSEPLIRRFEAETGLRVRAEYDIEASKTVGLVQRIRQESARTRCDVFWNNEIVHTIALAEEGRLAPYDSPSAASIPEAFRDEERRWTGFGARARVLLVNTERMDPADVTGVLDLLDPRFAGDCGLARPLTGTTLTHFASLFEVWGEEPALAFAREIDAANERGDLALLSGNGHVMRQVREGALAFGLTDTDDANVARLAGAPVAIVYPDQEREGTLLIPNTVAILADAPHREAAERFVDWLLSPAVEEELAFSRAAQVPVRAEVPRPDHVLGGETLRFLPVDWEAVGTRLVERQELLKEIFLD